MGEFPVLGRHRPAGGSDGFHELRRGLVADGAVGALLLYSCLNASHFTWASANDKNHFLIDALGPNFPVERLDKAIVGGLARPLKVERRAIHVAPEIEIARDEFRAVIDADRPRATMIATNPGQCRRLRIPIQSGRGFRFDVGRRSDFMSATIPK